MILVPFAVPTSLPVSSAEAAQHLRVDEAQIEVLETLIAAATNYLDGADGILGRALCRQTWDLKLHSFPFGGWIEGFDIEAYSGRGYYSIKLPLPPLVSVTHVKYIDTDGAEQTWPNTDYTVDTAAGHVYPAFGESYPSTRAVPNAVTVRFVAGYTVDTLPAADKLLVLALVANWHEHREPVVVGQTATQIPEYLDRLINARRLWKVA